MVIGKPSTIGDTVESKDACGRGEGMYGWVACCPSVSGKAAHCHRGRLVGLRRCRRVVDAGREEEAQCLVLTTAKSVAIAAKTSEGSRCWRGEAGR